MNTDSMSIGDVFQHMINGSFRCVTLAVVTPTPSATAGGQGGSTRCSAAKRLVAFGIST